MSRFGVARRLINRAGDSTLPWSDEEDESDEEDAFHLGEVSSDVAMDPAELAGIGSDEDELEDDSAYVLSPTFPSSHLTRIQSFRRNFRATKGKEASC